MGTRLAAGVYDLNPERSASDRAAFVDGTARIDGGGLLRPSVPRGEPSPEPPPIFFVLLGEPAFRASPGLRDLLADSERLGAAALHGSLDVTVSWSAFPDGGASLLKLSLDFAAPRQVTADLVLTAREYAASLWLPARGGLLALTTADKALSGAAPRSPEEALQRCGVLLATEPSWAVARMCRAFGWDRGAASPPRAGARRTTAGRASSPADPPPGVGH